MIIYLRHANDNQHRPKHKHDNNISKKGKKDAQEMAHKLIKKYGYPTRIYFSPFQRCKETVKKMMNELVSMQSPDNKHFCFGCYEGSIKLINDSRLSRYFTTSDKKKPSVSSKTLKHKIPIYESKDDFDKRISNQVEEIKNIDENEIIWCITHAYTFKRIANKLNIDTTSHIKFLQYFVYEK